MCCVAKCMNGVECFENSCFNWEGDILLLTVECPEFLQRTVVPQTSMEDFAGIVVKLEDSNHSDSCKPINKKHPAYKKLVEFIWDLLYVKTVIHLTLSNVLILHGLLQKGCLFLHFVVLWA